jgi:hypothetical protein
VPGVIVCAPWDTIVPVTFVPFTYAVLPLRIYAAVAVASEVYVPVNNGLLTFPIGAPA